MGEMEESLLSGASCQIHHGVLLAGRLDQGTEGNEKVPEKRKVHPSLLCTILAFPAN